ncbi:hypothetical protein N7457_004217 [Penicillium paradoxum]|uniref:uncharacterized protein n=1 Tax=Penicillium paradoxum TaxID=176176 RepID=UPI0025498771|nr:uncharacterized protein N7457_004217 [Penicillium paradoxum]KAJ5782443.1 hypothetical protein N7457_004217 [Penicillium paradoxum]
MADREKSDQIASNHEVEPPIPSQNDNDIDPHPKPTVLRQALVVAAGFITMFMTCALIFSYGVYQAIYEEMAQKPNTSFTGTSSSIISLIGTVSIAVMSLGGPFIMTWAKLYGPQTVIMAGGIVFALGCILASISESVWQFALTQGVLVGLGTCMAYVPTMAVVPGWFDERRGLAMGVVIAGSACGGMIWPPVLRNITTVVGFQNALRISGCLVAAFVPLAGYALRWEPGFGANVSAQTVGLSRLTGWFQAPLVDWEVIRSRKFVSQALGCFLQSTGYSTPLFFSVAYARALGYSVSMADNFITISNAANFVSRIGVGYAADRFGRLNVLFLTTVLSSVFVFGFWLPSTFAGVLFRMRRRRFCLFSLLSGMGVLGALISRCFRRV